MRDTPCAARGAEPLAFCPWRWGVAGRVDLPAEVGGGGHQYHRGRRQGGDSSLKETLRLCVLGIYIVPALYKFLDPFFTREIL
jgi:hypothetical protein